MTQPEIILHNESHARAKTVRAYHKKGLLEAMKLCQLYTGKDAKEAYKTVMEWKESEDE